METQIKTSYLVGLVIVLAIVAGLLLSLSNLAKDQRILSVSSYAECVAAGYPIMESYPSRCATPDGRSFVNPDEHVDRSTPDSTSTSTSPATTTRRSQ